MLNSNGLTMRGAIDSMRDYGAPAQRAMTMYEAEADLLHPRDVSGAAGDVTDRVRSGERSGREIELDFVRGLAILLVLDYHAPVHWMSFPLHLLGFPNFGWVGVDVFFVLSGFLVGGLLIKEWRTKGAIDTKHFLIRRGFKIWPQYYLFLALMLLTGHRSLRDLTGNLLNLQNYLGGVPHTWSLAVEEHAYLLLAFGLAWAARARISMRALAATLAAVCLVVVVGRLLLAQYGFTVVDRTHTRIEGILYGVLLAIAFHYRPALFGKLQSLRWIWIGSLLASLAYLRFQGQAPWASSLGWDAANLLGIALLMLMYGSRRRTPPGRVYTLIATIGVYSYGIYLWHVAVIAPSVALAGALPGRLATAGRAVFPIMAGIALGAVLTKVVELPALRLRDHWFPRRVDSPLGQTAEAERSEKAECPGCQEAHGSSQSAPQVAGV